MQQACVPTNTPATPPQFPDTLAAFAQLQTSSPAETSTALLQEPTIVRCQTQASKSWSETFFFLLTIPTEVTASCLPGLNSLLGVIVHMILVYYSVCTGVSGLFTEWWNPHCIICHNQHQWINYNVFVLLCCLYTVIFSLNLIHIYKTAYCSLDP